MMIFEIKINQPIHKVFQLFTDRENIVKWQSDIENQELISGTKGEINAKYKLQHKTVTLFETVISLSPPNELISEYEHQRGGETKMFHTSTNVFSEIGVNKTLYSVHIEQKVVGLLPQIIMFIFAGAVKKHHRKLLTSFKEFAEKQ